jgi:hypothetical protein
MMEMPVSLSNMIEQALIEVHSDEAHQLSPFRRSALYDAFSPSTDLTGKSALQWLEILTVQFVLPLWGEWSYDWKNYPTPAELVRITENKLRGILPLEVDLPAEILASEMVSLTSEDTQSPFYSTWCIFQAAVSLFFRGPFAPERMLTDDDLLKRPFSEADVAHFALIAYARRIHTNVSDKEQLQALWETWCKEDEHDFPLPWTFTLDAKASLTFWEWWLKDAIVQSWQLASEVNT